MDTIIALGGLILIFVLAYWRKLPMGAVALSLAYFLGVVYWDMTPNDVSAGFPGHLVITLIGVTYLFGIGHVNGTVDRIVASLVSAVRGHVVWIPWVFFMLAMAITASGALTVATLSILMPIGMSFAFRNNINPILMGLSVVNGTNAGGFSPVAVYYQVVSGVLVRHGIDLDPIPIFALTFLGSLVVNVLAFFLFGGRKLIGREPVHNTQVSDSSPEGNEKGTWKPMQWLTVATMFGVITATVAFNHDVGYLAVTGALLLAAFDPNNAAEGLKRIGWGVVLLIGGMVTYINVLDAAGIITELADQVANFSTPAIAALVLFYVAAFTTSFASSNAMFVIIAPLAAPLMLSGDVGVIGFTVALLLCVVTTDSFPVSTAGALVVANHPEHLQQRAFNTLMKWAISMLIVMPVLTWLIFVIIP